VNGETGRTVASIEDEIYRQAAGVKDFGA
jgi:hypothetical protein